MQHRPDAARRRISRPRHPDRVHPGDADLRLRRENYGDADLEAWDEHIRGQGWSEAYVFFKHEDGGTAPQFALRLMQVMGAKAPA